MEGLPELELREEHPVSLRFVLENIAVRKKKIENRLHLPILKTGADPENRENTLVRQKKPPRKRRFNSSFIPPEADQPYFSSCSFTLSFLTSVPATRVISAK